MLYMPVLYILWTAGTIPARQLCSYSCSAGSSGSNGRLLRQLKITVAASCYHLRTPLLKCCSPQATHTWINHVVYKIELYAAHSTPMPALLYALSQMEACTQLTLCPHGPGLETRMQVVGVQQKAGQATSVCLNTSTRYYITSAKTQKEIYVRFPVTLLP